MYVRAGEAMKACVDEAAKVANAMKDLAQGVNSCATGVTASVGWSQVTWLMPPGHPTLTLGKGTRGSRFDRGRSNETKVPKAWKPKDRSRDAGQGIT